MAKEVLEMEVKSNLGEVKKDASNAASEFKIMGVSLNGVKAGFASAAVTAKGMFGSIKSGLISTGIGAFVVLIASLVSYFTNTKRGAEMLERAMAGVGAVVSVVTDLFSSVGETAVSAFSDPKQAITDLWEFIKDNLMNRLTGMVDGFKAAGKLMESALKFDWEGVKEGALEYGQALIQVGTGMDVEQQKSFMKGIKDIGTEMNNEAAAAMRLKGMVQELIDEDREFSKVRAQTRQDIQKARLDALDESKTAEERLAAVQKANDLELKTTENVLEMQRRKIKVQKETMALSENMAEDLDELAALEVELIDLQTQSFQTQKRLATEMETLTNEIAADKKAEQKEIDDAADLKVKKEIADAKLVADSKIKEEEKLAKKKETLDKLVEKTKKDTIAMGFSSAKSLAKEGSAMAKAIGVAETIYNTQAAIMQAMKLPPPFNTIQAGLTGVMGAAAVAKILSTNPTSGGGGGGGATPSSSAPAPQMMSGAFDITGGVAPEPTRAYVVTDEMTNSQNQLANIRRRATI